MVFKDNRIVVLTSVRTYIIATVHHSHQGTQGCIRREKDAVYWPLINQQIIEYVSQCSACNTYRPEQCKEPLMPREVPDRPWAKVGADLFELQGQHYLLLVHYYSNFFELARLGSNTRATRAIDAMRCWSQTMGLSSRVRSSKRSRSYGASSTSRTAHDTHRATDRLYGPLEP